MTYPPPTLAIDFGTKRIGLAISRLSLAQPLKIIPHDEQSLATIAQICQEHRIKQLVIGISGRDMEVKTREFATVLEKSLQLPIHFWDENFSSVTVHHKLATSHMKKSKRQQPIDHFAASEILQDWLDSHAY